MVKLSTCLFVTLVLIPVGVFAAPPKVPTLAKVWEVDLPVAETAAYDPAKKGIYAVNFDSDSLTVVAGSRRFR